MIYNMKIKFLMDFGINKLFAKIVENKCEYLKVYAFGGVLITIMLQTFSLTAQAPRKDSREEGHRVIPYLDSISISRIKSNPKNDIRSFPLYKYVVDTAFVIPLNIGDTLPREILDLPLQVIDSLGNKRVILLRDFSSKTLLLLDFWTTWCSPCIRSMIKWESLQSKFPEKIALLGIHLDFDYKVSPFILDRGWKSPTVIGLNGYVLNRYFFDRSVISRTVWIKDRKILTISDVGNFGQELIEDYLEGKDMKLPENLDWTYQRKGDRR